MSRIYMPLLVARATVSLYAEAADGSANLNAPVWIGAEASGLELMDGVEQQEVTETGSAVRQMHDLAGTFEVKLERVWSLKAAVWRPFRLVRGSRYVLNICWKDEERFAGVEYQRTYFGCQALQNDKVSKEVMESVENQRFRAEWMEEG